MILSDRSIKERPFLIQPFNIDHLQPASYDLTLDELQSPDGLILPKEFLLASTLERINLPEDIVGRIEGKSSWARKGIIVHTAGFVDPGFEGCLVLEITNLSGKSIALPKGCRIAQIAFQWLDKPAERPYGSEGLGSHYQNQTGITKSAI